MGAVEPLPTKGLLCVQIIVNWSDMSTLYMTAINDYVTVQSSMLKYRHMIHLENQSPCAQHSSQQC